MSSPLEKHDHNLVHAASFVPSGRAPGDSSLADFLTRIGNHCERQRQYAHAREAYSRAIEVRPWSEDALINLGRIAIREARYDEAEQHFDLVLRSSFENYSALVGLATVHLHRNRCAEAARFAERAVRVGKIEASRDAQPYSLLAAAHKGLGANEQEWAALDEGLTLFPDAAELYHARANLNLRRGHWSEGWKDNEHRQSRRKLLRRFDEIEEWNGAELAETSRGTSKTSRETLLIFGEGGLDQQLFFSQYIPELLNLCRGQHVVLSTRPELARFFEKFGVSIVTSDQEVERVVTSSAYCRWVGLNSLPHKLGRSEPRVAVRQHADREAVARFAGLIGSVAKFRIGIYWSDASSKTGGRDAITFAGSEPIFNLPGCSFYSLRQTPQSMQNAVLDLASQCHDLADLAAAIENLDLVITTDSHVAHLAAIVGKPTWVLLGSSPCSSNWVWGVAGDDVQWYPTVRVFRRGGESFAGLMAKVSAALSTAANTRLQNESDPRIGPAPGLQKVSALISKTCRYGAMTFHHTDQWLGRSLDLYGEWSEGEVELFQKVVKPGAVVIEAGANVGALTVPLAMIAGDTGRVHAFEPQQDNFDCLARNVASLRNVTLWSTALAAGKYPISYAAVDLEQVCNLGSTELFAPSVTVPENSHITATIDELFPGAAVSFIKADVEGMELEILQGAAATIDRCCPILYVEDDREQNSAALRAWLISHGYRLYQHTPPLYNPQNWRGSRVNVFGRTVSINLLCIPSNRYELKNTTDLLQRVRA